MNPVTMEAPRPVNWTERIVRECVAASDGGAGRREIECVPYLEACDAQKRLRGMGINVCLVGSGTVCDVVVNPGRVGGETTKSN